MIRIHAILFTAAAWAFLATGCAKLNIQKASLPWPANSEEKYGTPQRIIAVWADTVYQHPGKSPARGFGGRIYFYDEDRKGIPVDGKLVIYAYDDTSPEASHDKPTRKYAFTAEQLTRYYSDSDLGASYNIWIPWDELGGREKQISLFPVFIDESGRMVRGNFSQNRLPGRRMPSEEERRGFYVARKDAHTRLPSRSNQAVRPVQYKSQSANAGGTAAASKSGLETTTIRIPRSLAERMAASTPLFMNGRPAHKPDWGSSRYPRPGASQRSPRSVAHSTGQATRNDISAGRHDASSRQSTKAGQGRISRKTAIASTSHVAGAAESTPETGNRTEDQRVTGPSPLISQPQLQPQASPPGYRSRSRNTNPARTGYTRVARTPVQQPANPPGRSQPFQSPDCPTTNGTGIQNAPLGRQGFMGAQPQHSVSATSRAWARQHAESAHFEPPRFRAPAKPSVQRHLGRETIQQSPLVPQSRLPSPN